MLAIAGSLVAATPAQGQAPVPFTCGAVLHQDAYLAADLACPSGNGVTATGPITIDLRGHHFTGPGTATSTGISVNYPNSVTIEHGRLSGWKTAVAVVSADPSPAPVPATSTIVAVNFLGNGTGLDVGRIQPKNDSGEASPRFTIVRSWFESNKVGIGGFPANASIAVTGTTFRKNGTAILFDGTTDATHGRMTVARSQFDENAVGIRCDGSYCFLDQNSFLNNPVAVQAGLTWINGFHDLEMTRNSVTGSRIGVQANDDVTKLIDNNIFAANQTAVSLFGNTGVVTYNVFSGNGTALTMATKGWPFKQQPMIVGGNRLSNNSGDAIKITHGGVQSWGSGVEIRDNVATFNGGWGIYAPNSVDEGGNQAYSNGRSPQCVGVIC